jgi:hypothetical protein
MEVVLSCSTTSGGFTPQSSATATRQLVATEGATLIGRAMSGHQACKHSEPIVVLLSCL